MSRDEATRLLVEGRAGRLCVRFTRHADGRVKTLDYSGAPQPNLRRRRLIIAAATLGGLAAAAMNLLVAGRRPVTGTVVMGEAPPWIPPTTAPTLTPSGATTSPSAPPAEDSPPPAEA